MSDKTEQPTQRRLDKSRKEANFPMSREFLSASQFLVFVWLMEAYGPRWFRASSLSFRTALTAGFHTGLTPHALEQVLWSLAAANLFPLFSAGLALTATILIAQIFVTRLGLTLAKLSPDFTRLNPLSRIRQLPHQNLPQFFQALILLPVFGFAVWAIVYENLPAFGNLPWPPRFPGHRRWVNR